MSTVTLVPRQRVRRLTLGVLSGALAVAGWTVSLAAPASAGTTSAAAPASAAVGCVATSATTIRVTIVIDTGSGTPDSTCVTLPTNSKGTAALTARADQLGRPRPRYDDSGLLCAIDGSPATGCGQPAANGGYQYWSYWLASGSAWNYATVGPGGRTLSDGAIDGWRFLIGGGTSADHAPRIPPSAVCGTPSATTIVASSGGSGPPVSAPSTTLGAPPSVAGPGGGKPSAPAIVASPGRSPASVGSPTTVAGDSPTTIVVAAPSTTSGSVDALAAADAAAPPPSGVVTPAEIAVIPLAASSGTSSDESSSGTWTLIGGTVIVIAIGAGLLTRRRTDDHE